MDKKEFIKWLETKTSYSRKNKGFDDEWKELIDYNDGIWDKIYLEDNDLLYISDYGCASTQEKYTFEDFVKTYENNNIK